jgi:hypothetical protein
MFQMARGGQWADKGLPPLEAGTWYRTVLRAAGRALDISVEHAGRRVQVYRGPIPTGGGGVALNSTHPVDLADIEIRETVPTPEDWDYAGRVRVEDRSPVPGAKCFRIDGPFLITDTVPSASILRPCILSAYLRADRDGVTATMVQGDKMKTIHASPEWKRHSFLTMLPADRRQSDRYMFGIKGSEEGPIWVAAPQVEFAPFDPDARRAAHWSRTLEEDYEVDEQAAHRGQRSLRSMNPGRTVAVQEGELAVEESRPMTVGAWYRADGLIKEARLQLELFRDRKYWMPKTPGEEEPRETFLVDLKAGSRTWAHARAKANPKKSVKRYRLTVLVESAGGTVWLDDLALCPLGSAGGPPAAAGSPDDALKEKPEPAQDAEEDTAMLGAIDDGADEKRNLLLNPGFEELMTEGVVTPRSDKPSSYGPTDTPNTWLKTKPGGAQ